ncbi:group 1 glycosyl transferase [Nostoc carneum NIES-2107]|nr:group 1 glycosyl transferase [Nostoc carneum NIES-2107]
MKVGWVSTYDARDLHEYSGRAYYAPQALKNQSLSIEYLGPLKMSPRERVKCAAKYRYYKYFQKKTYTRERDKSLLQDYARQLSQKLSRLKDVDVVFSGVHAGSQPIAYLECEQPIMLWTDATFARGVLGFYDLYWNSYELCQESIRDGIANERAALNKCSLIIYSSDWAAQGAIDYYQLDPAKVKVVPFGPNFECDRTLDDIKTIVDSRPSDKCKLLFLGLDWKRKGGQVAFQVAKDLNKAGLKTELTIVGCRPDLGEPVPDFVKMMGVISNGTPEGLNTMYQLLAESHFLIMPSLAESFGYVFCEASSFGLPSLATNVGGIPTAVKNDVNGRTFSKDASIDEYCSYISNLFSDYSQYKQLAISSFHEYESRLNWSVAGKTVKNFLESNLQLKQQPNQLNLTPTPV